MRADIKLKSRMTAAAAAFTITAAALTGCAAPGGGQPQAEHAYEPAIDITGDVQNVISLKPDGEGTNVSAEKADADKEQRNGWRISELVKEADPYSDDSALYIQGLDGMMASVRIEDLGENWLVFGENGWECVSDGYPESLGVKEIKRIAVVADDPSDVPASVNVMADDGIERTVSPGSLYIKDYESSVEWQGESDKNGKSVSVLLTDSFTVTGDKKLRADGNRIDASDVEK